MIAIELLKDIVHPIIAFRYRKDFYKWRSTYAKRLRKYKDIHKGKDCFIIANGPSLKQMDLNPLNEYYTFGLNRANLLFDYFDISFTYHVCVDDLVLYNIKSDLINNAFGCTSFIADGIINDKSIENIHIEKLFLGGQWTFHRNLCQPIHTGNTVTYTAMQIAYYMGFQRIFLIGVDHNWINTGKAHSTSTLTNDDPNHFHPDYFKNKQWKAPDIEGNEISYALAKYHFEQDGRSIFDATVNGKLSIFPKIDYLEALKIAEKKMTYPKISIVTPTYNQGQYIEETIQSVLNQNYPNLEYIIIDGGSTDGTVEIIKKYEKHLKYWVSEPDKGQANAINKGLEHCTGEIFNWLNSDDYLAPGALHAIAEAFKNDSIDAVAGRTIYFDENGFQEPEQLANLTAKNILTWKPGTIFVQPGIWLRSELIATCGGIDEAYHYCFDWDLVIRYLNQFRKVHYINNNLVYFRLHNESKTVSSSNKFQDDQIKIIKKYITNSKSPYLKRTAIQQLNRLELYKELETYVKFSDGIKILSKMVINPNKYFNRITLGKVKELISMIN